MNINDNLQTSESQNKRILEYMKSGKGITSLEALQMFGCMRLASRISDLRKRHPELTIEVSRVETTTGKRVARYYIKNLI
jgi:hypothetical protein